MKLKCTKYKKIKYTQIKKGMYIYIEYRILDRQDSYRYFICQSIKDYDINRDEERQRILKVLHEYEPKLRKKNNYYDTLYPLEIDKIYWIKDEDELKDEIMIESL